MGEKQELLGSGLWYLFRERRGVCSSAHTFLAVHCPHPFTSQELTECGPIKNSSGVALQGIPITLRMRLTCSVDRADVGEGPPPSEDCVEVLNEVVLSRGANPYLCNIEVYERDNYITQVCRGVWRRGGEGEPAAMEVLA